MSEKKAAYGDMEALIYMLGKFTNLPEFYDFLCEVKTMSPQKQFMEFLDRFGGLTLEIPHRNKFAHMARDGHIYKELTKSNTKERKMWLASYYKITEDHVWQIYTNVHNLVKGQDGTFDDRLRKYIDPIALAELKAVVQSSSNGDNPEPLKFLEKRRERFGHTE